MPHVAFVRENIRCLLDQYELIKDCLAGQERVKFRKTKYLPKPNPEDDSEANVRRYNAYITRAVFYNVSQRTLAGLSGQVFMRDPNRTTPTQLDPLVADATGSGVSLDQAAQAALNQVVPYGRCGLFIDYPDTSAPADAAASEYQGGASVADIQAGKVRPTIQVVPAIDCINYRLEGDGALRRLTLVVFREDYTVTDDGFATKCASRWIALRLVKGQCIKEVYQDKLGHKPNAQFVMRDATGAPLDYLPFSFIGSINNDPEPDLPPMYDLCAINIAHYRNSADYEENVYFIGQPTPWFSGLTEEWVKNVLKGKIMLGARGGVMLPPDSQAGILQVEPNTLAKEAMDQKEAQMLALGAKLVEGSQVQRTATEADIDNTAETSVLSSCAKNVGMAFKWALEVAARFAGAADTGIEFDLNTEFDLVNLSPEERKETIAEWQAGAITFKEMRDNLRRAGIATLDDDEAQAAIADEQAAMSAAMVDEAANMADATNIPPAIDPNKKPPTAGAE